MQRKIAITIMLLAVGVLVYLYVSKASLQIRVLTTIVHPLVLLIASYLTWSHSLVGLSRLWALVALIMIGGIGITYLDSYFIMALNPLHCYYFFMGVLGMAMEVAIFLWATWIIDKLMIFLKKAVPK